MDERAFLAELASRRALVTDRARTAEVREALAAALADARAASVHRPPRRPSASEPFENVPLDPSPADAALRPAPGGASPAKRGASPRTAVPSSRSRGSTSIASSLSAYSRRRSVTFASPRDEHDDAVRLSADSVGAAAAAGVSSSSSASLRGSQNRGVGPGTAALADAQTSAGRRLRFSAPAAAAASASPPNPDRRIGARPSAAATTADRARARTPPRDPIDLAGYSASRATRPPAASP